MLPHRVPGEVLRLVQKAVGNDRTLVNGVTTFIDLIDGECTQASPGRLLRHGSE
jgi:N-acyl-D-amino-acid deacylase